MTQKELIGNKAIEVLQTVSDGLRYSELVHRVEQELPEAKQNTIHGTIWNLDITRPTEVYKPARGLFRHIRFRKPRPKATFWSQRQQESEAENRCSTNPSHNT